MEWLKNIIEALNDYAGLFSLLAVVAAIVVPWRIYQRNRKEDLQRLKDELETRQSYQGVAAPTADKEASIRREVLKETIKRGEK